MKKLIAFLPVFLYYISVWNVPFFPNIELRWFEVLGLSVFAFLVHGKAIEFKHSKLFVTVALIRIFAILLSLTRTIHLDVALNGFLGTVVNYSAFFLLIPLFMDRRIRIWLLSSHLIFMFLWALRINDLAAGTELDYGSFAETKSNKNHIGMGLAVACVMSLYLSIDFNHYRNKLLNNSVRAGFFIYFGFIVFNLSTIYARSSLLAVVFGILAIMVFKYLVSPRKVTLLGKMIFFFFATALLVSILLPSVLRRATQWEALITKMQEDGTEGGTVADRLELLNKGVFLFKQNPFIGVGPGGGRFAVANYRVGLMHNSYMADLVDLGIIGLLSTLVWMNGLRKFVRRNLRRVSVPDRALLLMNIVLFFGMFFKDFSPIYMFTLLVAIIAYYRRRPKQPIQKTV